MSPFPNQIDPAMDWYQKTTVQTLEQLDTDADHGLTTVEAARRLALLGPNEMTEQAVKSPWRMLFEQFTETMVIILIVAAIVSGLLGKATETIAILVIVLMFALLGFIQEYRAEKAMAALKKLAVPSVRVRRDGQVSQVSARDLVPGDVVLLETGNRVPADMRLTESVNLRIQEAALTGESEAVEKETMAYLPTAGDMALSLGDRRNMAYMGTVVSYGRGAAIVTATGMDTELGKIATLIQQIEQEQTPLQRKLDQVGKLLAVVGLVAAVLVAAIGLLSNEPLLDMFVTAVSVAVAVVPEGLPAVVTITLSLAAQRMLKRQALIRKLPAVETLGSVTVICSDKTGTLTENRMTVTLIDVAGHTLELNETMRHRQPSVNMNECSPGFLDHASIPIQMVLAGGALCNDAVLKPDPQKGCFHAVGDPTEGALIVAAAQAGLFKDDLEGWMPRVAELPFDSERKRMTTVHAISDSQSLPASLRPLAKGNGRFVAVTKGAVDKLLDISTYIWNDERIEPMTSDWQQRIQAANSKLAGQGMRVLGVALRWLDDQPSTTDEIQEQNLTFVGLVGMIDPPRSEAKHAVETCKMAGIRPIMITGDHPLTAAAIAAELGIIQPEGRVLTGQELSQMSSQDLQAIVETVSVYARVTPEDKLKIVDALQARGQIVAMTGDGVNDSPALRKANIGVAMGITGTDVAKEAADAVLLDDNFATIVAAVEEGRIIYDNLLRFVKFSIGGNAAKVLVMLLSPLLGINVALLPLQLLWLNLLTDGLMGLGLGLEPSEKDTMQRPPRAPQASIFGEGAGRHMIWVGLFIALLTLGVSYAYYEPGDATWQTMAFTTLAFTQIGHALGLRASSKTVLAGLRANPAMLVVTLLTIALQAIAIYVPFFDRFFQVVPLSLPDLGLCAGLGALVWIAVRIEKSVTTRRTQPTSGSFA